MYRANSPHEAFDLPITENLAGVETGQPRSATARSAWWSTASRIPAGNGLKSPALVWRKSLDAEVVERTGHPLPSLLKDVGVD
jgi:hypothetical protein